MQQLDSDLLLKNRNGILLNENQFPAFILNTFYLELLLYYEAVLLPNLLANANCSASI